MNQEASDCLWCGQGISLLDEIIVEDYFSVGFNGNALHQVETFIFGAMRARKVLRKELAARFLIIGDDFHQFEGFADKLGAEERSVLFHEPVVVASVLF